MANPHWPAFFFEAVSIGIGRENTARCWENQRNESRIGIHHYQGLFLPKEGNFDLQFPIDRKQSPSACLPAYLPTCPPAHLPTCLPACLPAYLPACLLTYLLTYLPACLPAYLPTHTLCHENYTSLICVFVLVDYRIGPTHFPLYVQMAHASAARYGWARTAHQPPTALRFYYEPQVGGVTTWME